MELLPGIGFWNRYQELVLKPLPRTGSWDLYAESVPGTNTRNRFLKPIPKTVRRIRYPNFDPRH